MVRRTEPGNLYGALRDTSNNAVYRRNFAHLLRMFCQCAGINFSELARILAVDRTTVFRWARGDMIPAGEILFDMCVYAKNNGGLEYLIPDMDYLLGLDSESEGFHDNG